MADPVDKEPQSWAAATRRLRGAAAAGDISDEALFGDDPLAPKDSRRPMDYLGHFAKDEVAEEGHNSGAPKQHEIKRCYDGETAKRGYKVIPGNASDGYVKKKVREEIANVTTTSMRYGGPIPAFGYGPSMETPTKAPLRKQARAAKAKAGRGVGEATLRSKHK
jgi:hypothetical protein